MQQQRREPPKEPTERELRAIEQRVHQLVNEQRKRFKLPPLAWREDVARAARDHSKNMAERNFFSHTDPRLGDVDKRLNRFRIPWRACGENISVLQGYKDPARVAVQGWMSSPEHRANILRKEFTHEGVGVFYRRRDQRYYFTQIFIRPPEEPKR
ncbi:MAG: CAP domain-containing protein [Fimbriimonadales bacterium]|nr:CAP domain-containing protein [Fimbriimonadales bacterium]MDW8051303.1 CAP domain-containing protein [Armatimonadota bacterium]